MKTNERIFNMLRIIGSFIAEYKSKEELVLEMRHHLEKLEDEVNKEKGEKKINRR